MRDIKLLKEVILESDIVTFPLGLDKFLRRLSISLMQYTDDDISRGLIGGQTRNKTITDICKLVSETFDNEN